MKKNLSNLLIIMIISSCATNKNISDTSDFTFVTNDKLISKPIDNNDPQKVKFIKNKGSSDIIFNDGNYEINVNIDLTQLSIFSLKTLSNSIDYFEVFIKIDDRYSNNFKIDKSYFIEQKNFTLNINTMDINNKFN
ncbi:MAG: hypothetical protein U0354_04280 [Candidatus Sericytochromatia bacterium]